MNQGVEILLARMDSNPDEFEEMYGNKWGNILNDIYNRIVEKNKTALAYLKDDEVQALFDKLQDLKRDRFTEMVMSTLLQEETAEEIMASYKHQAMSTKITLTGSQIKLAEKLGMSPKEYAKALKEMKK